MSDKQKPSQSKPNTKPVTSEKKPESQAVPRPEPDTTSATGGRYLVNGRTVDANGKPV